MLLVKALKENVKLRAKVSLLEARRAVPTLQIRGPTAAALSRWNVFLMELAAAGGALVDDIPNGEWRLYYIMQRISSDTMVL